MIILWWLACIALVVLSALLLVAGIQGKEGVIRIGPLPERHGRDASGHASGQLWDPPGDEAAGRPAEAGGRAAPTPPVDLEAPGQEEPGPALPRRVNKPNVLLGAVGIAVGVAALAVFAL